MEIRKKSLRMKWFKKKYGSLREDLKINTYSLYFYPIFMIRRLVYVAILIILYDYPELQFGAIILFDLIPMLFYLIIIKPFKQTMNNIINIYNEVTLIICFSSAFIMNIFEISDAKMNVLGWVLIAFVLGSLVISWILLLPAMVKELITGIKLLLGIAAIKNKKKIAENVAKNEVTVSHTSTMMKKNNEEIKNNFSETMSQNEIQDKSSALKENEQYTTRENIWQKENNSTMQISDNNSPYLSTKNQNDCIMMGNDNIGSHEIGNFLKVQEIN